MEQCFLVARVPKRKMVTITSMYMEGDTKLWWRVGFKETLKRNDR